MTGWFPKHPLPFALAAALAVGLAAAAASQPIPLTGPPARPSPQPTFPTPAPPPAQQAPVAQPAPQPPAAPQSAVVPPQPGNPQSDRVQVGELKAPDLSDLGTLEENQGGLGAAMWKGSRRPLIQQLLSEAPADAASPAMRGLFRRLLLSAADMPEGAKGSTSLLGLRAARLLELGAREDALALAGLVPAAIKDDHLERALADHALLDEDFKAACARAVRGVRDSAHPYWLKLSSYCRATSGEKAQAELGLALLREQGDDDGFLLLAQKLFADPKAKFDPPPVLTPLNLTLLNWAEAMLPAASIQAASPGVAAAAIAARRAEPGVRLAAAERAFAAGAIAADRMAQAYAGVEFSAAERKSAPEKIEAGPRRAALLYQQLSAANPPLEIAARAAAALDFATARGRWASGAMLLAPHLAKLEPSMELLPYAGKFARALLAADQIEPFSRWRNFLDTQAAVAPLNSPTQPSELWALAMISEESGVNAGGADFSDTQFERWLEDQKRALGSAETARGRAALLLLVYEALGGEVADARFDVFSTVPAFPGEKAAGPVIARRLAEAVEAKRRGEVALLSLIALGPSGPATVDAATLIDVVGGLNAVGLKADAGRIALEAMLARGF